MSKKFYIFLLFLSLFMSCKEATIPLVGIDADGNEVVQRVAKYGFQAETSKMINLVARDTLNVLSAQKDSNDWQLNEFHVGLLLSTSVGPALWQVGATPGFRLEIKKNIKEHR